MRTRKQFCPTEEECGDIPLVLLIYCKERLANNYSDLNIITENYLH